MEIEKVTDETTELLKAHLAALRVKEAAILAKTAPLREQREKLHEKINEIEVEIYALTDEINAINSPPDGRTLYDIKMAISATAKALGARSLGRSVEAPAE